MPPPLMAHGAWLMADFTSILEALASAERPADIGAAHNISMIELIELASQPEHAALLDKAHALHARQRAMRQERLAALALDKLMDIGLDDTPPANNLEARHRAIRLRALTSVVGGGGRRQSTGGVVRPSGEPYVNVNDDPSGVTNDVPPASGGGVRHPRLRTSTPSACGGDSAPAGCRGLNGVKATPSCVHGGGGAGDRTPDVTSGRAPSWPSLRGLRSDHGTRARADSVDQVQTRTGGTPVPPARPARTADPAFAPALAADPTANPSSPCLRDSVVDSAARAPPPAPPIMRPWSAAAWSTVKSSQSAGPASTTSGP